jgi:hypothetical protein
MESIPATEADGNRVAAPATLPPARPKPEAYREALGILPAWYPRKLGSSARS